MNYEDIRKMIRNANEVVVVATVGQDPMYFKVPKAEALRQFSDNPDINYGANPYDNDRLPQVDQGILYIG
jgi:hypothetical protein